MLFMSRDGSFWEIKNGEWSCLTEFCRSPFYFWLGAEAECL